MLHSSAYDSVPSLVAVSDVIISYEICSTLSEGFNVSSEEEFKIR